MEEDLPEDEREVSNDNMLDEEDGSPWFNMGMSKEEIEARRPWRSGIIIN